MAFKIPGVSKCYVKETLSVTKEQRKSSAKTINKDSWGKDQSESANEKKDTMKQESDVKLAVCVFHANWFYN